MNKPLTLLLAGFLALGVAQAQTSLPQAITQAYQKGSDVASQLATLNNAKADLAAKQADPSTLVVALTQAKQSAELELSRTTQTRLSVMQSVMNAHLSLYEAQENIKVLQAQVALNTRNLEVAKAKLEAKNGTQLDVSKAENTLASSKQNLADANAQLPILSAKLETLLGSTPTGKLRVSAPPAFAEKKVDLAALEQGLDNRLANLVQANNTVELASLNVKLADNDYTPASTLRDAKTSLDNATRTLETTRQSALTNLRDAYRNLQAALEKVRIAQKDQTDSETSYKQDQTRFQSGTISKLQLQQSELSLIQSRYAALQTADVYWKALAALSVAAGQDVSGLQVN